MNNRLINTKVAGGGGCTDIVDNYDPFGGNGVALYQLNGDATDVSGNYNGTATNVTYGTGVFGQAGVFNGSSSYITATGLGITGNSTFTVSTWIKTTSSGLFFFFGNGALNASFYIEATSGGNIRVGEFDFDLFTSAQTVNDGGWHNVVFTTDGTTSKLYIDGSQTNSLANTFNISADIMEIGRGTSSYYFNGSIDQVRIFNTALTPLEVEALYTEELCICDGTVDTLDILGDGSCIATYQLDGNANDLSGNYSGTPTDVSYGVGEFDLAAVFTDPNTRKIDLPSSLNTNVFNPTSQFSLSMWINMNDVLRKQFLFNCNTPNNINLGFNSDNLANGKLQWTIYNTSYAFLSSTTALTTGVWYNVVVTYNNGLSEMFIDNVSQGTITKTLVQSSEKVTLGYRENLPLTEAVDGSIDQVRIFNKALSAGEVTTLYNETACTYTPPREAGVTQILGDSSCILYWKLDGTSIDETGSYNGNFLNSNYGKGEFGQYSALFNGVDTRIVVPNRPLYTMGTGTPFSISAWVKLHSLNSSGNIYAELAGGNVQYKLFYENTGVFEFHGYYGFQNTGARTTTTLQTNVWYHIVGTVQLGTVKIYLNNVEEGEFIGSPVNRSNFTNYDAEMGAFVNGAAEKFDGQIDQVRFFNKTISPSEVTTLYNEGI